MEKGKFFDKSFFDEAFGKLTTAFSKQHKGEPPIVEFVLDDGTEVHVAKLVEAADGWVSVLAYSGRAKGQYRKDAERCSGDCVQVTVPLGRIRRIVHRGGPESHIGFGG
jgi:hypothetical protein